MSSHDNSLSATDKSYDWQQKTDSLPELEAILEKRREELIQLLTGGATSTGAEHDEAKHDSLLGEWVALLLERDRILRARINQDNQKLLDSCFLKLHDVLSEIGQFDHSATPVTLKRALCSIYWEVQKYCKEKELSPSDKRLPEDIHAPQKVSEHSTKFVPKAPPLPQPSETLTPLSKPSSPKRFKPGAKSSEGKATPLSIKQATPSSRSQKRQTPRNTPKREAEDLRRCLLTGKENLRVTPGVKRSPGGTPIRQKRPYSLSHTGDLVAVALQRKFLNVRKLYGSPSQINDTSFNPDSSLDISVDE